MTLKKTQTRQSIQHKLFKITSSLVLFVNLLHMIFFKFSLDFYLEDSIHLISLNFMKNVTLKKAQTRQSTNFSK